MSVASGRRKATGVCVVMGFVPPSSSKSSAVAIEGGGDRDRIPRYSTCAAVLTPPTCALTRRARARERLHGAPRAVAEGKSDKVV